MEATTEWNKILLLLLDVSGTCITQPACENTHTTVLEHKSASTWCLKWPFSHAEPATQERYVPDPLYLQLSENGNTGSRHLGLTDKPLGSLVCPHSAVLTQPAAPRQAVRSCDKGKTFRNR